MPDAPLRAPAEGFTVVVPTRNRPDSALALARYLRASLGWPCPLVFVDQSDDGGVALGALLREAALDDVHHLPSERRGTGAARNAGALAATGAWLLFLDDDVRPSRTYLATLERYVASHPWLDAVQPGLEQRAAWEAYATDPDAWLEARRARPAARAPHPAAWDGVQWFTSSPQATFGTHTIGVASGNLLVRRAAYLGVGGFDEHIEGRGDDREFGLRLWWFGYEIRVCPDAVAFHLHEATGGTRVPRRGRRLLRPEPAVGWVYFYLRWFPGRPYRRMLAQHVAAALRRPWTLPVKLLRLRAAVRAARGRLRSGPRLLATPVPRDRLSTDGGAAVAAPTADVRLVRAADREAAMPTTA